MLMRVIDPTTVVNVITMRITIIRILITVVVIRQQL